MLPKIVYWVGVLAISLVLVVLLILWFESRDASRLEQGDASAPALSGHPAARPRPVGRGHRRSV